MRGGPSDAPRGELTYQAAPFSALSGRDVYDALALRALVFVVEQQCVYLDPDGKDPEAVHLLGRDAAGLLGGYARIFVGHESHAAHVIGRVIVHPALRGTGGGRALLREAIAVCEGRSAAPIELSAQAHLARFYESLGFRSISALYVLDGIEHVDMRRLITSA